MYGRQKSCRGIPVRLREWLHDNDLDVRPVMRMSPLRTRDSDRWTYRVALAEGQLAKVRFSHRQDQIDRMFAWHSHLPSSQFHAVTLVDQNLCLESWVPGRSMTGANTDLLVRAGMLFGRIHSTIPIEQVTGSWQQELLYRLRHSLRWLTQLDWIRRRERDEFLRLLLAHVPLRGHWGLMHGDFCSENMVVSGNQVVCIDNMTVRPGLLEMDWAKTVNRWTRLSSQLAAFSRRYAPRHVFDSFRQDRHFWRLASLIRSACWRAQFCPLDAPEVIARMRSLSAALKGWPVNRSGVAS